MATKQELVRAEDEAWEEIHDLIHGLTPEEAAEPGLSEEWTAKDLVAHLSCWQAEAATVLCQIRMGTFNGWDGDEDETNRRYLESTRNLAHDDVMAQLHAARYRMLEELDLLPEAKLTGEAEDWFRESGSEHYLEHLPRLKEWLGSLRGGTV